MNQLNQYMRAGFEYYNRFQDHLFVSDAVENESFDRTTNIIVTIAKVIVMDLIVGAALITLYAATHFFKSYVPILGKLLAPSIQTAVILSIAALMLGNAVTIRAAINKSVVGNPGDLLLQTPNTEEEDIPEDINAEVIHTEVIDTEVNNDGIKEDPELDEFQMIDQDA